MGGLVRRLLLLETLPQPVQGRSLLVPDLAPAWSQLLLQLLTDAVGSAPMPAQPASPISSSGVAAVTAACSRIGLAARGATAAWVNMWHGLMRARGSDYSSCEAR